VKSTSTKKNLVKFIQKAGIPQKLGSDGSKEQMETEIAETSRVHHIKREITVPHSPWQNFAEASIRQLKQGTFLTPACVVLHRVSLRFSGQA
jgi:hypothetical protein